MFNRAFRDFGIGIERVWIITETTNFDALVRGKAMDFVDPFAGERGDIDMSDAGKLSLGFADGPSH